MWKFFSFFRIIMWKFFSPQFLQVRNLYYDSTLIICTISRAFVLNCSIKCHNRYHRSVYSLGGLFFAHLDVSCRVGSDIHVIYHPSERNILAVRYLLLHIGPDRTVCRAFVLLWCPWLWNGLSNKSSCNPSGCRYQEEKRLLSCVTGAV